MIFITKRAFENEIDRRMSEINFKTRTDEKIWKIEEDIRNLKFRVDCLEERDKTAVEVKFPTVEPGYEPAPYWTNPSWKAPDITCSTAEVKNG